MCSSFAARHIPFSCIHYGQVDDCRVSVMLRLNQLYGLMKSASYHIDESRLNYLVSSLIFVIKTGGCGGFFASVRDIGVTGQQQQAATVSAEEDILGGAGGFFSSLGGGTNPSSPVPSPAKIVPVQNVAARTVVRSLFIIIFMVRGERIERS